MNPTSKSATLLILIALLTACVPARKYEELQSRYKSTQESETAALAKAQTAEAAMKEQSASVEDLTKRKANLERDTTIQGTSLRNMTVQYDKINKLNTELLEKYNALLAGESSENRKLLTDLEATRLRLQRQEDSLSALARSLGDREAKLADLQKELAAKDAAMKSLKDRVSAALAGFEGKGLTVTQKDGKIYVNLDNKLLFKSGSTVVESEGKQALGSLGKAIENEKDLAILVEGHTDTDKIAPGSSMKDNWDLSVLRATSVVRILQESSRIDPKRITAGGRGEYVPVDPADKAKNRRIEVILAPDLAALYKLVQD
ncbi:MAG: OmpA family protein [Bacteroidetes bacterium]|jgi:chemotaxis protein MotB|nr:OmpA family protein [Bacteroidota bacterium]MBX7130178.1 OmpA family protein [Flavobacteriales bacterium]MCC6655221.1 OmpA family protein [Flavobacteriales bacterium]HMU12432.1 OmpA family protein [Flavobacteriales bacterium]HMW97499.1 OmpA family protein [Flavobacteriales bacterium]